MRIECSQCGRDIERYPCHIAKNKHHFCSRKCQDLARRKQVQVQCSFCNKSITRQPNQIKNFKKHFCDKECRANWQREHWVGKNSPAWKDRSRLIICDYCSKQFERKQSAIQNSKNQFCGRKCKHDFQRENSTNINQHLKKRVYVNCSQCGNIIERCPSLIKNNTHYFCTRSCFGKWKSENWRGEKAPGWQGGRIHIVQCSQCSKEIERNLSEIKDKENIFCSRECYSQWQSENERGPLAHNWKGGYSDDYGQNWQEQRTKIRQRDHYTCQHCSAIENGREHDVHHIKPFREFNYIPKQNDNYILANDLANLICLCRTCHRIAE